MQYKDLIWEIESSWRHLTRVGVPKGSSWFGKIIDIQIIPVQVKNTLETITSTFAIAQLIVPTSFDTIIADTIDDIVEITNVEIKISL